MSVQHEQKRLADEHPVTSIRILAIHLIWFFLGPIALLVLLFSIMNAGTGWLTARDIGFYGVLALIVFARWADQKSGQSVTSEGKPSTWDDFRHFALTLPAYAVVAWIVAKMIGYFSSQ